VTFEAFVLTDDSDPNVDPKLLKIKLASNKVAFYLRLEQFNTTNYLSRIHFFQVLKLAANSSSLEAFCIYKKFEPLSSSVILDIKIL